MIANDYLTQEAAVQREQQEQLARRAHEQQQTEGKAQAARALEARHRPTYTKAKPASSKARKAARRQAKAGRKASR